MFQEYKLPRARPYISPFKRGRAYAKAVDGRLPYDWCSLMKLCTREARPAPDRRSWASQAGLYQETGKVLRVLPSDGWVPGNQGWLNFWETRLVIVRKTLHRSCWTELTCQSPSIQIFTYEDDSFRKINFCIHLMWFTVEHPVLVKYNWEKEIIVIDREENRININGDRIYFWSCKNWSRSE